MVSHFVRKMYFQEVSKKKILTKEEQLNTVEKIEELKNKLKTATKSDQQEKIQEEIQQARNLLIESCYFIVVKIAKKYRNRYLSFFDLIEEGNLALIKSLDTFDYRKNVKFSTYVTTIIKNKILTAIAHRGRMVRIDSSYPYGKSSFVPVTSPGQAPFRTFTSQLGMDSSKMFKVIKNLQQQTRVDGEKSVSQDSFDKFFFYSQNNLSIPEIELFRSAMIENIKKIKKILTPREHEIIIKYYGLNNEAPKHYNKISKQMDLTSERIRQIHNQAIEKIKKSEMYHILKDFLSEN